MRAEVYANALQSLIEQTGLDESEVREMIRENSQFRMMLRMTGIDPDQIR